MFLFTGFLYHKVRTRSLITPTSGSTTSSHQFDPEDQNCPLHWLGPVAGLANEATGAVNRHIEAENNNTDCRADNVRHIRQLMASSYGTCEALDPPEWGLTRGQLFFGVSYPPKEAGEVCGLDAGTSQACRQIACYTSPTRGVMNTHPYNKLTRTPACRQQMQKCRINQLVGGCGSLQSRGSCPVIFSLDQKQPPYLQGNQIDIFKESSISVDRNGSQFIGWNCSEYVTTAMALAGYRIVPEGVASCANYQGGDIGKTKAFDRNGELNNHNTAISKPFI